MINPIWILGEDSLKEIYDENICRYFYRFIAGELKGSFGSIHKRFLFICCENKDFITTTNPLEAYTWECIVNSRL